MMAPPLPQSSFRVVLVNNNCHPEYPRLNRQAYIRPLLLDCFQLFYAIPESETSWAIRFLVYACLISPILAKGGTFWEPLGAEPTDDEQDLNYPIGHLDLAKGDDRQKVLFALLQEMMPSNMSDPYAEIPFRTVYPPSPPPFTMTSFLDIIPPNMSPLVFAWMLDDNADIPIIETFTNLLAPEVDDSRFIPVLHRISDVSITLTFSFLLARGARFAVIPFH